MKLLLNKTHLPGFNKRTIINLSACLAVVLLVVCIIVPVPAHADAPPWTDKLDVTRLTDKSGRELLKIAMTGRPPEVTTRSEAAVVRVTAEAYSGLTSVPAFRWSYGCSPTSAAMLFGYYDLNGYPNMYTGPANGGACPLTNAVWGGTYSEAECPLSASHQGIDNRTTRGHVDDYWVDYGSYSPDPYLGHWAEHTPDSCGDFMGSNQSQYGNSDGTTSFYIDTTGGRFYDPLYPDDGCHGMRLFAESRGYTVVTNYTQYIKGKGDDPNKGFTFADYCAEIDAGRPVMIHVQSHTMMGYGYDTAGSLIYLHDTWDYNDHTMAWGGSYPYYSYQLAHWGVSVIQLAVSPLNSTGIYGRVGVGIDPPQYILHVSGSGPGSIPLFQRGTDSAGFIIERTPANRWAFGVNESPTLGYGFVISTIPEGTTSVPRLVISPSGNVTIAGSLSAGAKNFRIDHPLNPADKYLSHSFIESPDMLNLYSGNVVLDGGGGAVVELPSYFTALNRDYTYQLDTVGGFAPLYVKQELKDNKFTIAGGKSGMRVSWQVTGIRSDPYAVAHPFAAEQGKPVGEKGFYMHPAECGQQLSKGIR